MSLNVGWIEDAYKKIPDIKKQLAKQGFGEQKTLGYINAVIDAYEHPSPANTQLAEALRACVIGADRETTRNALDAYTASIGMNAYKK